MDSGRRGYNLEFSSFHNYMNTPHTMVQRQELECKGDSTGFKWQCHTYLWGDTGQVCVSSCFLSSPKDFPAWLFPASLIYTNGFHVPYVFSFDSNATSNGKTVILQSFFSIHWYLASGHVLKKLAQMNSCKTFLKV